MLVHQVANLDQYIGGSAHIIALRLRAQHTQFSVAN